MASNSRGQRGGREPQFDDDATPEERRQWLQAFANTALFDKAKDRTVERLIRSALFRKFAPGSQIIEENQPATHVHFLLLGVVRVYQSNQLGQEYSPKVFVAPTHFGDLGALSHLQRNGSSAQALGVAVTAAIDNQLIHRSLEGDHGLCLAWLYSIARQHTVTIDSDRQNVFGGVASRLVNVLLSLADVFGREENGLIAIDTPLSYAELAQQVACSRRAAITIMQRLGEKDLVKRGGDRWLVDVERLRLQLLPGHLSMAHSFLDVGDE